MAAKLQCEICGGKLIGRPGGVFECDSCGMEYDTAWAKAKIQEITGTVKVEGTVEVTGKVQVDGPVKVEGGVNKEALLKRGNLALKDREWDKAAMFFDQALSLDAEYGDAWLGLEMARKRLSSRQRYAEEYRKQGWTFRNQKNTARAKRYAVGELREWFADLDETCKKEEEALAQKKLAEETVLKEAEERLSSVRNRFAACANVIAAGSYHTVAIRSNGSVSAVGYNDEGQCKVSSWKDIVSVVATEYCTIGVRSNGTVLTAGKAGDKKYGVFNFSDWQDIAAVAASDFHAVGLRKDGSVAATGSKDKNRCKVSGWKNIKAVAAGNAFTLGLCSDGTVKVAGDTISPVVVGVKGWSGNIVAIASNADHAVGLKANGTVLAAGKNDARQCNVSNWRNIVAVAAGGWHTVGLKADGTVVATGQNDNGECNVSGWKNIVAIAAGDGFTVGVQADGKVVAVGCNDEGACNVSRWKLFDSIDTLEDERKNAKTAAEKAKAEKEQAKAERKAAEEKKKVERRTKLEAEQAALSEELKNLKGLFTGKRRKEIETRLAEIAAELG